jgi:hypothetical protein
MKSALLVLVFALLQIGAATLTVSDCGGNCPAGNCPDCLCGERPEIFDLTLLCVRDEIWS